MELKVKAPLDLQFAPMSVVLREYEKDVAAAAEKVNFNQIKTLGN